MPISMDGPEESKAKKRSSAKPSPKPEKKASESTMQPGQTAPDDNLGPGGRPTVRAVFGRGSSIVDRPPKEGDEKRPRCLRCSDAEVAVLMGAKSKQGAVTYYSCPICGETSKKLADAVADAFRDGIRPRKQTQPIVQRPM